MKNQILVVLFFMLGLSLSGTALAGSYDIKEMTPAVNRALENRSAHYETLHQLKSAGEIGESNQGYVQVLKNASTRAAALAETENADRRIIYKAIVDQNGLGPQGLVEVQKAFAEVQRDKAKPGEFIQVHSGEWMQKF